MRKRRREVEFKESAREESRLIYFICENWEEDEGLLIVRTKVFFSFFFALLLLANKQLNARGQQPQCKACQDLPAP